MRQSALNTISIVLTLALTIFLWVLATRFAEGESGIELEEPPDRLMREASDARESLEERGAP